MPTYNYKDGVALAYERNKKRLRLEGTVVLDAMMNEALSEMTAEFNKGLERGEILEIGGSQEDMRRYLKLAAQKELSASSK